MRITRYLFIVLLLAITTSISGCLHCLHCPPSGKDVVYLPLPQGKDVLFQVSTIDALLEGIYDGDITCKELKNHGDFGIGTFNGLDGEMIELDGNLYQVRANGVAYPADDSTKVPFAAVTFFEPDKTVLLNKATGAMATGSKSTGSKATGSKSTGSKSTDSKATGSKYTAH
jgi:acetolactate decarboxylase